MQKIISIGEHHKDQPRSKIFSLFLYEDWDTLLVSGLVVVTHLVFHYILNNYVPASKDWILTLPFADVPFIIVTFILAFILGYAGQRLIYRFLGSTEKNINKRLDALEK